MADGRQRDEATANRLGRNVRAARRRFGLSQEELGTRCGLHRTEIGYIENGRRMPRVDTLMRVAGALEVRAEVLLEGIEWVPPPPPLPPVGWVIPFPV